MGGQLDKPVLNKSGAHGETRLHKEPVCYATSSMQGWRKSMEDAHAIQTKLEKFPNTMFFGVFDGHGGQAAAQYAARNLAKCIFRMESPFAERPSADQVDEYLQKRMKKAFLTLDQAFQGQMPRFGYDFSGSTAVTLTVTKHSYIAANLGDSRLIIVDVNGDVVFATVDHKPYLISERRRIEQAGGSVRMQRVNGDLAVSRALGDFRFKAPPLAPDDKKQVIAIPTVDRIPRANDHQFALLACDGIWDVMTSSEVASFVSRRLWEGMHVRDACDELIDYCLDLDSKDNMSIILVHFSESQKRNTKPEFPPYPDTQQSFMYTTEGEKAMLIDTFSKGSSIHERLDTHSFNRQRAIVRTSDMNTRNTKITMSNTRSRALAARRATLVHDPKALEAAVESVAKDRTTFKIPTKATQFSSRNPMVGNLKNGSSQILRGGSQFSSRNPLEGKEADAKKCVTENESKSLETKMAAAGSNRKTESGRMSPNAAAGVA